MEKYIELEAVTQVFISGQNEMSQLQTTRKTEMKLILRLASSVLLNCYQ